MQAVVRTLLGAALLAGHAAAADADLPATTRLRAELGFDARLFADDGLALSTDHGFSLAGRLDWRRSAGPFEQRLRLNGRFDSADPRRNLLLVEEAALQWRADRWRLRIGAELVNWSATEAFHPADVINARNLDSDLENFDKIGEPMAALQYHAAGGSILQLMLMPYYTPSRFAAPSVRLSFAPPGLELEGRQRRFDRAGQPTRSHTGLQYAVRLQRTIGSADLSVHWVEHLDRLQPLTALSAADGQPLLLFQHARQFGLTWQQAFDSGWLLKVEGAQRSFAGPRDPAATARGAGLLFPGTAFPERDHTTLALGLEYGWPHRFGDSTLLLEAQAVHGVDAGLAATLTPFQRDLLLGHRLAFANEAGSELLGYVIVDAQHSGERLWNLSYRQRLGADWSLQLGLRLFEAPRRSGNSGFAALRGADHLRFALTRHF